MQPRVLHANTDHVYGYLTVHTIQTSVFIGVDDVTNTCCTFYAILSHSYANMNNDLQMQIPSYKSKYLLRSDFKDQKPYVLN